MRSLPPAAKRGVASRTGRIQKVNSTTNRAIASAVSADANRKIQRRILKSLDTRQGY